MLRSSRVATLPYYQNCVEMHYRQTLWSHVPLKAACDNFGVGSAVAGREAFSHLLRFHGTPDLHPSVRLSSASFVREMFSPTVAGAHGHRFLTSAALACVSQSQISRSVTGSQKSCLKEREGTLGGMEIALEMESSTEFACLRSNADSLPLGVFVRIHRSVAKQRYSGSRWAQQK